MKKNEKIHKNKKKFENSKKQEKTRKTGNPWKHKKKKNPQKQINKTNKYKYYEFIIYIFSRYTTHYCSSDGKQCIMEDY